MTNYEERFWDWLAAHPRRLIYAAFIAVAVVAALAVSWYLLDPNSPYYTVGPAPSQKAIFSDHYYTPRNGG